MPFPHVNKLDECWKIAASVRFCEPHPVPKSLNHFAVKRHRNISEYLKLVFNYCQYRQDRLFSNVVGSYCRVMQATDECVVLDIFYFSAQLSPRLYFHMHAHQGSIEFGKLARDKIIAALFTLPAITKPTAEKNPAETSCGRD